MSTILRLDKNALMYLLEVMGEEFKIELSNAVVANASRALVRNLIPDKMAEVVRVAAEEEVREQIGYIKDAWSSKRTVHVNNDVRQAIEEIVASRAKELVNEAYDRLSAEFEERIEYQLSNVSYVVDNAVNKIKREAIQKEIRDRLSEIVAATEENLDK